MGERNHGQTRMTHRRRASLLGRRGATRCSPAPCSRRARGPGCPTGAGPGGCGCGRAALGAIRSSSVSISKRLRCSSGWSAERSLQGGNTSGPMRPADHRPADRCSGPRPGTCNRYGRHGLTRWPQPAHHVPMIHVLTLSYLFIASVQFFSRQFNSGTGFTTMAVTEKTAVFYIFWEPSSITSGRFPHRTSKYRGRAAKKPRLFRGLRR
jgi:hypothetical protein